MCLVAAGGEAFGGQTLIFCRLSRVWTRYAALGDSFTEGLMDEVRVDGRHRGWADRLAQSLADERAREGQPGIEYANLAVRGRLLGQVIEEQVPAALNLGPDLVSLAAGVNDCLRRSWDVTLLALLLESAVAQFRETGADVLLFSYGDPGRRSKALGRVRERICELNAATEDIAGRHNCYVVSYWGAVVMDDPRLWHSDRLHLSARGHDIAARSAQEALGLGSDSWRRVLPYEPRPSFVRRVGSDVSWVTGHALPWLGRRLRGESSGDRVLPKDVQWRFLPGRESNP